MPTSRIAIGAVLIGLVVFIALWARTGDEGRRASVLDGADRLVAPSGEGPTVEQTRAEQRAPRVRVRLREKSGGAEPQTRDAKNRRVQELDTGAAAMEAAMTASIDELHVSATTRAELRDILADLDRQTEELMTAERNGELSTLETRQALLELQAAIEARERNLLGDEVFEEFDRKRFAKVMRVIERDVEPGMRVIERDVLGGEPAE